MTAPSGSWTRVADIRTRVRRRWDDGSLLRARAAGVDFPVIEVPLRGPRIAEIGDDLGAVQAWVAELDGSPHFTVVHAEVGGRLIGRNRVPARAIVDSYDQAWRLLGVTAEARRYDEILTACAAAAAVRDWVAVHPLKALADGLDWPALVAAYRWLDDHRGRGVQLRTVSAPGVDTKFVERHRGLLGALLGVSGSAAGFVRDLGLAARPETVRLRFDSGFAGMPESVTGGTFERAELAAVRVGVQSALIVENEATFLSVPVPHEGVAIWGRGFEVGRAGSLPWLREADVRYWGDLDTHGFAILDRLRAWLPRVRSVLMDRETLLAHRQRWVTEPKPAAARLTRLTTDEAAVYDDLVADRLGTRVRLEQERIDWEWVEERLEREGLTT